MAVTRMERVNRSRKIDINGCIVEKVLSRRCDRAPAVEFNIDGRWWLKTITGKTFQDERMRNIFTKGQPIPDLLRSPRSISAQTAESAKTCTSGPPLPF